MKNFKNNTIKNRNYTRSISYCAMLFLVSISSFSQVGIGTTAPEASSILDVVSTDKGILIPRVSLANITTSMLDGTNIAATGLLIYNINAAVIGGNGLGYYYFNGIQWQSFSGAEKINDLSDGKSDNDGSEDGSSLFLGISAGENDNGDDNRNVGIGFQASNAVTSGLDNTAIGYWALKDNTRHSNTAIGAYALQENTTGHSNTAVGDLALTYNKEGIGNTAVGYKSMQGSDFGDFNTVLGYEAFANNYGGDRNIAVGYRAYYSALSLGVGNDNIAIGIEALYENSNGNFNIGIGSNTLYNNFFGSNNIAIGNEALSYADDIGNTAVGDKALYRLEYGDNNTAFGAEAGISSGSNTIYGYENVFLGYRSGYDAGSGSSSSLSLYGSVFLGSYSGSNEPNGNRLYIENTDANADNALIYGEFGIDNTTTGNILRTNSQFQIGNPTGTGYAFPLVDGTSNQILQSDGSGAVSWVDGSTLGSNDNDWHEEGTTNSPNNINDDIYTQGNVAIGKTTADYPMDVYSNTSDKAINVGITGNDIENSGIYIRNSTTGNGLHHGVYNDMTLGNGLKFGVRNELAASNVEISGVLNNMIGNGSGSYKGINNFINATGTGRKYGCYTRAGGLAQGDLYGVYSDVRRSSGIAFSGYFVGNVAIGTESNTSVTPDHYIFPSSRGTVNQIMQTDATGNVSWVDPSSVSTDNQNISGSSLTGTTLTIGIESGTSETVDLSALDTGGDITEVIAGDGLTGGGTNGALILDVVTTNGLTTNANDIVLGGTLTQATNITQGTNNLTFNLNNSGDFNIQGNTEPNLFYADGGNDRIGVLTNTPQFDIHLVQPNTFVAGSSGIGFSTGVNNWKIYHSGLHFSFVENGVRRAYVEGGTGTYVVTSDRRLKKSITEVESILDKVNGLKAYRYLYKDQEDSGKKILGLMAQDVEPLFPELVGQAEDGYLGLNYSGFGVVAIKAIQEQQVIIKSQQKQINDLQKDNEDTNTLLNELLVRVEILEREN